MKRTRRKLTALLTLCFLAAFVAVPIVLTWQLIRHEQVNPDYPSDLDLTKQDRLRTLFGKM